MKLKGATMDKPKELEQLALDYKVQLNSPAGERIIDSLKSFCGYDVSFFEVGDDVNTLAYLEGRRSVILFILDKLKAQSG